jgi:hypothetical protein
MEDDRVLFRYQRKPIFSCVTLITFKNDLQHSVRTPVHISNKSYEKVTFATDEVSIKEYSIVQYCTLSENKNVHVTM